MKDHSGPVAYLITPGKLNPANFIAEAPAVLRSLGEAALDGVAYIQIREKDLAARLLFELTVEAIDRLSKTNCRIIVNDRVDVALSAGAAGVHLRGDSMPPAAVRKIAGNDLLIGASTHSSGEVRAAIEGGADYAFYGPIFDTPGKGPPTGTDELRDMCARFAHFPIFALGGVNASNLAQTLSAGAAGVAAIRAFEETESRRMILRGLGNFR